MARLTGIERQQRFKEKRNKLGQSEFRGAWLTVPEKAEVRKLVDKLISRRD